MKNLIRKLSPRHHPSHPLHHPHPSSQRVQPLRPTRILMCRLRPLTLSSLPSSHTISPLISASPASETNEDSDVQTPPTYSNCNLKHYNSAGKSLNRLHTFVQKTSLKPDTCVPVCKSSATLPLDVLSIPLGLLSIAA